MVDSDSSQSTSRSLHRWLPGINLALAVLLVVGGLWYASSRTDLAEVGRALAQASPAAVLLGVAIMLITNGLKAWRWQLTFADARGRVGIVPSFWATCLGQYVNLIVPFMRLGEVARIYSLNQETRVSGARTLGTLVLEKTLDLIFFGLTIAATLPFVLLPVYVNNPGLLSLLVPLLLLTALFVIAFRTDAVIAIWRKLIRPLPDRLEAWFERMAVAGLEGLASLRDPRLALALFAQSTAIALLGIALPYTLAHALGIEISWLDAALIHIVVSIAIAPPSTPAKIGVFNAAAALMLWQFGLEDQAAIISFSILFHLVVIGPQIVLGLIAAARSNWRWQTGVASPAGN